jgi:hypothetical protein
LVLAESGVMVPAGPPIARAENDVGGLLDTTKGWTLDIPDPRQTAVASQAVVGQQKQSSVQAAVAAEPGAPAPVIASR